MKSDEKHINKDEKLSGIYCEYKCRFPGKEYVFGCGCTTPKLLLIGEAPGREEVKFSRPFSGAAGKWLDSFLQLAGINRDDIYITNAIKYRLSKENPKTGRLSNRPAARDEIKSSRPYLLDEIGIIRPCCIVTLGNVPLRSVTGNHRINIGECHGTPMELKLKERDYLLFPLYHPASVIYNRSLVQIFESDILKLREMSLMW
jgi:uracil-DNA glycosylase family 4